MAYKALYRMYRPNSFDEVAGQKHIVKTLQNAVKQNKIAHAYLFCGPRGTGKTSIAKIFAKAVNCTHTDNIPCLECESCKAIKNNTHPDIVEIDAASNNGVEEVRSLIEKVKYAPIEGKYKVYIIDEVHMMSTGAFNALLKTIEEPPAHVIFILATTEPHKVLPTIISRCQRYDFMKVTQSEMEKRISEILEIENIQCEEEVIRIVAQLSDGGMRDALSIMDQCIAYAQDHITVQHINDIYGITTTKEKIDILDSVIKKDLSILLDLLNNIKEKGTDIKRLTTDLIEILKESIIYTYTKDIHLIKLLTKEEVEQLVNIDIKDRLAMIDILIDTYDKYKFAANIFSYFEVSLLKMMTIENVDEGAKNESFKASKPASIHDRNVSRETSNTKKETVLYSEVEYSHIHKGVNNQEEMVSYDTDEIDTNEIVQDDLINSTANIKINEKSSIKPLTDEFVLRLLVGANKPEKIKDMESFKSISKYITDLEWAKQANNLKHAEIMASGENYLILIFNNQAEANDINEKDLNNEFCEFTNVLFKTYKKIFAISTEQKDRVISDFKARMANGSLPEAYKIDKIEVVKDDEVVITQEQSVIDLFGKDNVIIMEE